MLKKLEFFFAGLIFGLFFFFVPSLSSGELGIPWVEKFTGIFGFAANNFLLYILLMGIVYAVVGVLPFGIYYFLRKRNSKGLFFSFLFFSLGFLMSYAVTLLTLLLAFKFSSPTIL